MNKILKTFLAMALSAIILGLYAGTVRADGTDQTTTQTVCTSDAYGQNPVCHTETQVTPRTQLYYNPTSVNTGLDFGTLTAGTVAMIGSAGAAVLTLKKKVA